MEEAAFELVIKGQQGFQYVTIQKILNKGTSLHRERGRKSISQKKALGRRHSNATIKRNYWEQKK